MKTLYFIKTPSGEKIGPYRSKNEADSQLYAHEGACTAEYYQLDKREQRIRNINPKLHSFATIFTIAGMLVIIALGIFLIWFGYARQERLKGWVETSALLCIDSIEEEEQTFFSTRKINGCFYYDVAGEAYMSTNMGNYTDDDVDTVETGEPDYYLEDEVVTCYVNPNNPEEAVLFNNPEASKPMYYLGAFVIFCGLLVLITSTISGRKCKAIMSLNEEQIL